MPQNETNHEKLDRVARQMGSAIRRQAHRRWETVRTAERNQGGRHVWRFQSGPEGGDRFLHVPHAAMVQGDDPAPVLLEQLKKARWLDRLNDGSVTSLLLAENGRLEPLPEQ